MPYKKRKKTTRWRGSHTHGRGFKKKARGSGHRGGVGMAGTGKRGDQKKTMVLNLYGNDYFGKDRALRRGYIPKKLTAINISYIVNHLDSLVKRGLAKESKGNYELNLKGYKVLAEGEISIKVTINTSAASAAAIQKIESAGGKVILEESNEASEE